MFRARHQASPKMFNQRFQDVVFKNNKQLSQSTWMSFNWRTTVRDSNLCYLGPRVDFINFLKTNLERSNMNVFLTDSDLFWYTTLHETLEEAGYNIMILRDIQSLNNQHFESAKQAVFLNVADETVLGTFCTQWINDIIQNKYHFSIPLLFIPAVPLPNLTNPMTRLMKYNIHLTLHGENIELIKRIIPRDNDVILALFDTLIVSDMSHSETARRVQHIIELGQELASLPPPRKDKRKVEAPPITHRPKRFKPLKLKQGECFVLVTGILPTIDKKL